jgi:MinD superfamily P-loop ATPase
MKIAVLSGKGGTGKTFVSVNLATSIKESLYVDCDVEEPNGHIFLKPENIVTENVTVKKPYVIRERCIACKKCVEFCKFNALALAKKRIMVFEDICHSCGGCKIICPQDAIQEKDIGIGTVQKGASQNVKVLSGRLNIGVPSGTPIIQKLLMELLEEDTTTIIDCPPGSSCLVMESIKEADYCILVAEPSLYGAHNLEMVYELVKLFNKPHGVILNKYMDGINISEDFCIKNDIPVLEKIHFTNEIGLLNSKGLIVAREDDAFKERFLKIIHRVLFELVKEVRQEVEGEEVTDS